MVDAAHHVSCVTFTGDDVVTFLYDVMGLNDLTRRQGVPPVVFDDDDANPSLGERAVLSEQVMTPSRPLRCTG